MDGISHRRAAAARSLMFSPSDVSHGHAQFEMHVPPYFSRNTLHHGPETYVELSKVVR